MTRNRCRARLHSKANCRDRRSQGLLTRCKTASATQTATGTVSTTIQRQRPSSVTRAATSPNDAVIRIAKLTGQNCVSNVCSFATVRFRTICRCSITAGFLSWSQSRLFLSGSVIHRRRVLPNARFATKADCFCDTFPVRSTVGPNDD